MNWLSWIQDRSFVNGLMFPAPVPTYDSETLDGNLIYVPKRISDPMLKDRLLDTEVIPCTFFQQSNDVRLLTILLHGNASDIGACRETAQLVGIHLNSHVLCPEYPGYGIYPGAATEETLNTSFEAVYNWVISPNGLNWPTSQLIIIGRSIGSGPATHVCQQNIRIAPQKRKSLPWGEERISGCVVNTCTARNCQGELREPLITTDRMSTSALQCYLKAEDIDFPDMATRKQLVSIATYHNINVGIDFTEDPFILVKRAALLKMLENEKIPLPQGPTRKVELIKLARKHRLIPHEQDWGGPLNRPKAGLLVLLSGFVSIKHVVKSLVSDIASKLIFNRFDNFKKIKNVTCPVLIIHGKQDELIPVGHAKDMWKKCKRHRIKSKLVIHDGMTHNELLIRDHVALPIAKYLDQLDLNLYPVELKMPAYARTAPHLTVSIARRPQPDHSSDLDEVVELRAEEIKLNFES